MGGGGPASRAAIRIGPFSRIFQSTGFTPIAFTATRTSPARTSGVGSSVETSGSPRRQLRMAIARIRPSYARKLGRAVSGGKLRRANFAAQAVVRVRRYFGGGGDGARK